MDSLLANYASSDDESEVEEQEQKPSYSLSKPCPILSLPPPKSSKPSLFSSLPPPKTPPPLPPPPPSSFSSSLFSSLPPPKSHDPDPKTTESKHPLPESQTSLNPNPKRVVQFTLPLNPSLLKPDNFDDEDEEEEEERKPLQNSSTSAESKRLSTMLPAPKNSLCLAPSTASRQSAFDSGVSASNAEGFERRQESSSLGSSRAESFGGGEQERGSFVQHARCPLEPGVSGYENYGEQQERSGFEEYGNYTLEQGVSGYENYGIYDGNWAACGSVDSSYGTSYESGGDNYGGYASNWSDVGAMAGASPVVPEMQRIVGKRGRNEIPPEILEVNQTELIKNRPREDQVKLTGIAFGPAYQPVSTSKGKPLKLHKRKHQIGTLYYDMKQKEMELSERRAKGFLTKAETQAKYGW